MSEEELRKTATEYELYANQLEQLERRLELVQNSINEMELTKTTLEALKNKRSEEEFLSPIGSNSFIKAKFLDTGKVLMGLGANIIAEVTVDHAIEELTKRKTEFQKLYINLRNQMEQLKVKFNAVKTKLEQQYLQTRQK
ncbi:MAG: prefoldin subunit alpha [Candidatus Odinarchaeum yellowstonii]|jgi:prefoldin alpha subunit|uniref:Prefoldin subunit alpha n=1 Tax=Odinarchaeota yellowstonii (strain LCB_4) TaxID=1841599 RepID=A0AAF0IBJ0_ODILC|nr:MAG: prefoldin subunit alpha [Candidatus Odinarchaeum yellowstonii]